MLEPGDHDVDLHPNLDDHGSLVVLLAPDSLHPRMVELVEGRDVQDSFSAYFRCSTRGSIQKYADSTGIELVSCEYLGQYPAYLQFNSYLFQLATYYEKLISSVEALRFLRGWLLVDLRKRVGGEGA